AQAKPELIRAILIGHRRAVEFMIANRAAAAAVGAKIYKLEPAVVEAVMHGLMDAGDPVPFWGFGELHAPDLDTMLRGMKLVGAVDADMDWRSLVDQSYLPADLVRPLN